MRAKLTDHKDKSVAPKENAPGHSERNQANGGERTERLATYNVRFMRLLRSLSPKRTFTEWTWRKRMANINKT